MDPASHLYVLQCMAHQQAHNSRAPAVPADVDTEEARKADYQARAKRGWETRRGKKHGRQLPKRRPARTVGDAR